MLNLKNSRLLRKSYTTCGIAAYLLAALVMLALLLLNVGVLRAEFHVFPFLIVPNFVSKLLLIVWTLYYATTSAYGRDVNDFAKSLIILSVVNIIVIAADESTRFYYFAQSVTGIMYTVFMCILVFQRKYAVQAKKYATLGYSVNIFIYLTGALQVFVLAISLLDKYDAYLVMMIGIFNLMAAFCILGVSLIEQKYIIVMNQIDEEHTHRRKRRDNNEV